MGTLGMAGLLGLMLFFCHVYCVEAAVPKLHITSR